MLPASREFRLFFIGRTVDLTGSALTPVVLALSVLQATNSVSDTGLVLGANVLPTLVFMLLGGALADRQPRARILTVTCWLNAAVQLAIATLLFIGFSHVLVLALLAAASGMIGAFTSPALRGIVPDLVPEGDIQAANAALATSRSATKILGPAVAGALVAFVGGGWAFVIDAATFMIAALFFRLLPGYAPASRSSGVMAQIKEGVAAFSRLRWVSTLSLC